MKFLLIFLAWLAVYIWTVGAVVADNRHLCDFLSDTPAERLQWEAERYRTDLAFAVGWSLLPPAWIITPFMTRFYQHGWVIKPPRIEEWQ